MQGILKTNWKLQW